MGRKKAVKKTKEVSTTMAESPAAQQMTPRKRGRPRKIVEKKEAAQEEEEDDDDEKAAKKNQDSKKSKISEGEAKEKVGEIGEEGKSRDKEIDKEQQLSPRSRARKKSKPRKST